jgi:hypothetical protein
MNVMPLEVTENSYFVNSQSRQTVKYGRESRGTRN